MNKCKRIFLFSFPWCEGGLGKSEEAKEACHEHCSDVADMQTQTARAELTNRVVSEALLLWKALTRRLLLSTFDVLSSEKP